MREKFAGILFFIGTVGLVAYSMIDAIFGITAGMK